MQFLLNKLRFYFYITTFPFDIYYGAWSGTEKNCSPSYFFWESWDNPSTFISDFIKDISPVSTLSIILLPPSPLLTCLFHTILKCPSLDIFPISGKIPERDLYSFLKFILPSWNSSTDSTLLTLSSVFSTTVSLFSGVNWFNISYKPIASTFNSMVWFLANYIAKSRALFYCMVGPISYSSSISSSTLGYWGGHYTLCLLFYCWDSWLLSTSSVACRRSSMAWVILSFSLLKGRDSLSLSLLYMFKFTMKCSGLIRWC